MSEEIPINNVLVAIDPSEKEHNALNRALLMAKYREDDVVIHLVICMELEKLHQIHDATDYYRDTSWFEELTKPLVERNITYTSEVFWTENWHLTMLDAAKRHNANFIILSDYARKKGLSGLTASKWSLFRDSQCPVLIVVPSTQDERKCILAAVNMQTSNPRYADLNEKILTISAQLADSYAAEKHIVNSYEGGETFPDRAMLIREGGIKNENIHVESGNTTDVIVKIADKINADVVVIGTLARKGVMAAMKGNKSEDIIQKLDRDVMIVNS